ncbi:MAG: VOC family protein [Bacteroidetes bacterium]|nr:VOC family protein [Bacteroidota bacterium]
MNIPQHYNRLMPYLIVPHAYEFISFMKEVFGAEQQMIKPRGEDESIIMHGELRIGDGVIMFADATEQFAPKPAGLFIYVHNVDDIFKKALALGARPTMEPQQQGYGYTCGFHDPFGNDWWPVQAA